MKKYSDILEGFKKLNPRAIALFGSYGMDLQDKYSHDIDVVVYADEIPNTKTKEAVFSSFSDRSIPTVPFPYDVDIFARKQEFCEVAFRQCQKIDFDVSELVEGESDREEEVAIFVYYTKVLYDDGWLNAQKARMKEYPQKLLATNLFSFLFSALRQVHYYDRAIKKRKQPYWAELCLNEGLSSLVHAVFAANKTYYGKNKWAEVQCRDFKLKPKDFEQRLLHVMKTRDVTAYERLALDVCTLCQKCYPKECADVVALDSRLSQIDDYIESQER
jgi:predicted nucleotidyltransferase